MTARPIATITGVPVSKKPGAVQVYLVGVDIQKDFCPGGKLAVPQGDSVVEPWNRLTAKLRPLGVQVIFSRDRHPAQTKHFSQHGREWPEHCLRGTAGAEFGADLDIRPEAVIVDKGVDQDDLGYSAGKLAIAKAGIPSPSLVIVGGLATGYRVKASVPELLDWNHHVYVVEDAIRAVDLTPGDGTLAPAEIRSQGATVLTSDELIVELSNDLELSL